jgi:hypothetical protein
MMLRTLALVAGLILASAVPAAAQSMCSEPIAPAPIDGKTATLAQLHSAVMDVKTFLKQSDDYQDCINQEWVKARDAAVKAKQTLDPNLDTIRQQKIMANQALKEKVGAEYNAAATAYKQAHPGQ